MHNIVIRQHFALQLHFNVSLQDFSRYILLLRIVWQINNAQGDYSREVGKSQRQVTQQSIKEHNNKHRLLWYAKNAFNWQGCKEIS